MGWAFTPCILLLYAKMEFLLSLEEYSISWSTSSGAFSSQLREANSFPHVISRVESRLTMLFYFKMKED